MSEEPQFRYRIGHTAEGFGKPESWQILDTTLPNWKHDGCVADFYEVALARKVFDWLNEQEMASEDSESKSCVTEVNSEYENGFYMIERLNTRFPFDAGKPNEWVVCDGLGRMVGAFHIKADAYEFLHALEEGCTASQIVEVCESIKSMLIDKNRKYGDSALNPCRVFSKSDALEQIRVRMDDKLSRIRNAQADDDEDAYMDLAGYLVLYLVARGRKEQETGK